MPAGGFARPAPAFHPPLPPSFHSGFPNGILGAAGWRLGRNINGSRGAGAAQARPAERGGKRGRKREKAPSPQPWSAAAAPRPLPCTPPNAPGFSPATPLGFSPHCRGAAWGRGSISPRGSHSPPYWSLIRGGRGLQIPLSFLFSFWPPFGPNGWDGCGEGADTGRGTTQIEAKKKENKKRRGGKKEIMIILLECELGGGGRWGMLSGGARRVVAQAPACSFPTPTAAAAPGGKRGAAAAPGEPGWPHSTARRFSPPPILPPLIPALAAAPPRGPRAPPPPSVHAARPWAVPSRGPL